MYGNVLFDLDGTLTDSGRGIIHAVRWSLGEMGIEAGEDDRLRAFVGPPLADSYYRFFGLSGEDAERAVFLFRKYYNEMGGLFENEVYPGIRELLERLSAEGKRLIIATYKRGDTAVRVLEHFDLMKYFDFVAASEMVQEKTKAAVVQFALKACGITDTRSAVMVGDRENDIAGARAAGIDSVGVLYGYGSREELEDAGPTYLAGTPEEIAEYVLR
ncbi:MAG: HAD-IA family hydrolase [Lachnospiraceae bacterium]|nr:HAD-IA family hydrolase [Lachnospiraceae bacterium]